MAPEDLEEASKEPASPISTGNSSASEPPADKYRHKRRKICWFVLAGAIAVALAFAIFVPVALFAAKRHQDQANAQLTNTTTAPGSNTTETNGRQWMVEVIRGVSKSEVLDYATSPQAQALSWLLNEDEQAIQSEARLLQRYAVLVGDQSMSAGGAVTASRSECDWTGVVCGNSSTVTGVAWARRGMKGTIPEEIRLLSNLTLLDLGENYLQGSLPEDLFALTNLEYLYLHSNQLTGTLSESFLQLSSLIRFYGGDNQFHGSLPKGLGSRGQGWAAARPLRWLSLRNNSLTGALPNSLNWRYMFWLDLGYNQFTGSIPLDWMHGDSSLINLRDLFVDHNQYSGTIPPSIVYLGNGRIDQLVLNDNLFSGEFLADYESASFLQTLHLHRNNFSAIDPGLCSHAKLGDESAELVSYTADCHVCWCLYYCDWCFDS